MEVNFVDYSNVENIGYLLNKASRSIKWQLNKKLEKYNVTSSQWSVLKDLDMHDKENIQELTPASVAERLNIDRPTMSGIISRLSKNNWIETRINPEDKRSQIIMLTAKAKEVLNMLEDISDETVNIALKGFTKEEIKEIKNLLRKIIDNLSY